MEKQLTFEGQQHVDRGYAYAMHPSTQEGKSSDVFLLLTIIDRVIPATGNGGEITDLDLEVIAGIIGEAAVSGDDLFIDVSKGLCAILFQVMADGDILDVVSDVLEAAEAAEAAEGPDSDDDA